jgi:hypothetical protein
VIVFSQSNSRNVRAVLRVVSKTIVGVLATIGAVVVGGVLWQTMRLDTSLCAIRNRLTVHRVELRQALIDALTASDIEIQIAEGGQICYRTDQEDYVRGELIRIDTAQRP